MFLADKLIPDRKILVYMCYIDIHNEISKQIVQNRIDY